MGEFCAGWTTLDWVLGNTTWNLVFLGKTVDGETYIFTKLLVSLSGSLLRWTKSVLCFCFFPVRCFFKLNEEHRMAVVVNFGKVPPNCSPLSLLCPSNYYERYWIHIQVVGLSIKYLKIIIFSLYELLSPSETEPFPFIAKWSLKNRK